MVLVIQDNDNKSYKEHQETIVCGGEVDSEVTHVIDQIDIEPSDVTILEKSNEKKVSKLKEKESSKSEKLSHKEKKKLKKEVIINKIVKYDIIRLKLIITISSYK